MAATLSPTSTLTASLTRTYFIQISSAGSGPGPVVLVNHHRVLLASFYGICTSDVVRPGPIYGFTSNDRSMLYGVLDV
ncbi:Protein of unknown function [Pyronema omphalodes CBS 100304]|uniref:Uncharacterized protein n=1 Tax=Pyronema omphalodes (strain CBS 100304) TaxID=1076935 RepID=U4LMF7_PYROM|nr:Protein of unknown function [Pyronema omphalodes CBS 100304]